MKTKKSFSSDTTKVGDNFLVRAKFLKSGYGVDQERKTILSCIVGKGIEEDFTVSFRDGDIVTVIKEPYRPEPHYASMWVQFVVNDDHETIYDAFWTTFRSALVKIIEE